MFLAPIWMMSTSASYSSSLSTDINSTTMGNLVTSLAYFKYSRPSSFKPWKLYGEVLGLKAPPLKNLHPPFYFNGHLGYLGLAFYRAWTCNDGQLLSADRGRLPISPSFRDERVGSPFYGSWTWMTFSTPSISLKLSASTLLVSPIMPIM